MTFLKSAGSILLKLIKEQMLWSAYRNQQRKTFNHDWPRDKD